MTTIRQAIPILAVRDLRVSIEYYQSRLGFERSWGWDAEESFGGVGHGDVEIYFCRGAQGHPGTWIVLEVDDVDALHRDLVARGADIHEPPVDCPWGMREMLVADPDQHRIRFSTPIAHHHH